MKAVKSPFKLFFVILLLRKPKYKAFKQIASGKHFYQWQWNLLDRIYKVK